MRGSFSGRIIGKAENECLLDGAEIGVIRGVDNNMGLGENIDSRATIRVADVNKILVTEVQNLMIRDRLTYLDEIDEPRAVDEDIFPLVESVVALSVEVDICVEFSVFDGEFWISLLSLLMHN